MTIRVAINGFGRIGKCILRAYAEARPQELEIVAVNAGFGSIDDHIHLLKYDSTHGILPGVKKGAKNSIDLGFASIPVLFEPKPEDINWAEYGVDIVLECTGIFATKELAAKHIASGAKKVIVSAPCKDADATIVYGVNEEILDASHKVISIGSCTTNCLAPVAKILNDSIGIETGFMTTIHAYTNDQKVLDSLHSDLRRARASAVSMIPTSTGAAKALGLVLPELSGKLDGTAIRVPTPNVSMVDLTFTAGKSTSANEINDLVKNSRPGNLGKALTVTDEELVSIDFNHNSHSSIFDMTQTKVVGERFCRVVSWYDNEWGFSNRMLDMSVIFGNL